jgi:hypothetical protein
MKSPSVFDKGLDGINRPTAIQVMAEHCKSPKLMPQGSSEDKIKVNKICSKNSRFNHNQPTQGPQHALTNAVPLRFRAF